ncbi:PREDICTED: putative uncharacterized protein DDB_G0286901 [Nicotiana attenuata]|uniref:VQ domain-containing protein n=1 Tax=Nicotiana attenuata TaxID=49451 RepID=A0A1J6HSW5_NICAT|nr:PREDICTED: putative uncharacterized protein DDB_G0286901 [Nicotiana attenuata]OIS96013.1 hypothetical protein A4A49_04111 [Nicotiana attenuata]
MDSGNSGSMQSSSGGDEEYDSRGESISTFLNNNNNNPTLHFGSISSNNNPPPPFLSHHQHPTFFDPHSQNLDTNFPQNANSQFNTNDLIWSQRGLRSDQNFNNFGTSSANATQVVLHQNLFSGSSSVPLQQSSIETAGNVIQRASNSAQPEHQPNVVKNPKKRTRASRRAPTTVLTTDTTNFRQMVQEFTGIPTAPFTGSAYTRRLDLFSTAGSAMRSGHLDTLGLLYPSRPSAQKVNQVSPFMPQLSSSTSTSSSSLLSSSMIDALMPTNNNTGNNNSIIGGTSSTSASTSTSTNFQLGSDHLGMQKQAQNLFNMQNQILSFKQHHPLVNNAQVFGTKSSQGTNSTIVPSLDELGISHDQQVSANLISGYQGGISSQTRNDGNNLSRLWRSGGNGQNDGGQENQLRSFGGNNNNNNGGNSSQQHVSGYKFNCSGNSSTSEFHNHEKGLENVCSTGEGPVSSWTNCPSE